MREHTQPSSSSTPEIHAAAAGFATDMAQRLDYGIRSGLLRGLHAVLVSRHGVLVMEHYGAGEDEAWGRPLGHTAFGPGTLHDLRSVTKSVVGLLYGMALDRGLVPAPDTPLLAGFPEHADLAADPARARLTVRHALTMTLGLEWDEDRPYTDAANSEIAMEQAPDRYRFALDRPVVAEPGTRWIYSGGAVALIGALIERGTGRTLPDFAREALFGPLGIDRFEWATGHDGVASAASGLRLTACDLMRLGTLVLGKGEYEGRRVVSEEWIAASSRAVVATGDGLDYGFLWFLGEASVPVAPEPLGWMGGFGNGGQRLWIMPELGICLGLFAGNYNAPDAWVGPTRVWREIVLANLVRA